MALTLTEGTRPSTLDLMSRVIGAPIGYARIVSWHVSRSDPSFVATFDLFLSAAHAAQCDESSQQTPMNYEWGCTLRAPEDLATLAQTDDREVLYRHVEYLLHYQDAERRYRESPADFDTEVEEAVLVDLETALGIQSLFHTASFVRAHGVVQ